MPKYILDTFGLVSREAVEVRALALVSVAINLDNCNSSLVHESLRHFLVIGSETLAVTAPRRVEFNENIFAGVENDRVKVSLVH